MLEDAAGIRRVVLACGTVDLRKGIDGLATIVGENVRILFSYIENMPIDAQIIIITNKLNADNALVQTTI